MESGGSNSNKELLKRLEELYPNARSELNFRNAFEILVATMLAAQCTDARVNMVTPALFRDYPTPDAMAKATSEEIYPYVKSCGFKKKAENLVMASRKIMEDFGGSVPSGIESLQTLPGVGRKTANVVFANAFGGDAIAVDTHVFRVSNRLGLAHAKDVLGTEKQLMEAIPKEKWSSAHHWILLHGRRVCAARKPRCADCEVSAYCEFYLNTRQNEDIISI